MSECILLVGNIGSGKSEWIKYISDLDALVINDDAIVSCIHGGDYVGYTNQLKPLYKSVENLIFGFAAAYRMDVVIDRPNLTIKTRRRYIGLAHSFDMDVQVIVFPFENPTIHAQRRMDSVDRGRGYPLEYWTKLATIKNNSYVVPEKSEGISEIEFLPDDWYNVVHDSKQLRIQMYGRNDCETVG